MEPELTNPPPDPNNAPSQPPSEAPEKNKEQNPSKGRGESAIVSIIPDADPNQINSQEDQNDGGQVGEQTEPVKPPHSKKLVRERKNGFWHLLLAPLTFYNRLNRRRKRKQEPFAMSQVGIIVFVIIGVILAILLAIGMWFVVKTDSSKAKEAKLKLSMLSGIMNNIPQTCLDAEEMGKNPKSLDGVVEGYYCTHCKSKVPSPLATTCNQCCIMFFQPWDKRHDECRKICI